MTNLISDNIVKKSIKDFLTPTFLGLSVLPFLVTFAILLSAFLYLGTDVFQALQTSIDSGVVPYIDPVEHPIITSILSLAIFKWVFLTFFYLIGGAVVILFSVIIAVICIGFFTPMIVKIIQKRHYPDFKIHTDISLFASIWLYVKTLLIFIMLLLIVVPILLIPGVNLFMINIPFYYLFHNLMLIDVAANINTEDEFQRLKKSFKGSLWGTTGIFFLVSLIPFAGLFFQVLFVIILTHIVFTKTIILRN